MTNLDAAPAATRLNEIAAAEAGLRYVSDRVPGIRRVRAGKGFKYLDAESRLVSDPQTLSRIKALVIPPAWKDVWISPHPLGHLQAAGRDSRGRKQYRYHARWRAERDSNKYARLTTFARALPRIRLRVSRDLRRPGLSREKVLATIVRLLDTTNLRVGNEEYARANRAFGLTTLRDRHVEVDGGAVRLIFRGKGGKQFEVGVRDKRVARIVKRCQDLPGQHLFQYFDRQGRVGRIDSDDVNSYLREAAGEDFTAKDFRTWAGTVMAAAALRDMDDFSSQTEAKRNVVVAVDSVSRALGNTRSVCRKCYIHPAVIETYLEGKLRARLEHQAHGDLNLRPVHLRKEELAVLGVIRQSLRRKARAAKAA